MGLQRINRSSLFKTITLVVVFVFAVTQVDIAYTKTLPESKKPKTDITSQSDFSEKNVIPPPEEISLPSELGVIDKFSKGKNGKLIIHIQDAHANLTAQKNIARIIEYLHKGNIYA